MKRKQSLESLIRAADAGILELKVQEEADEVRVMVRHQSEVPDAWLPLEQESRGTRQLLVLAPIVIDALGQGSVLLIDELEASFHPLMALELLRAFNDPARNPKGAQLIFSTHDTNLLGNVLGPASLQRDQVWFTEKDPEGATRLYPLSDYSPRKGENLERGYLQGRYGAIPFVGEITNVGKPRS